MVHIDWYEIKAASDLDLLSWYKNLTVSATVQGYMEEEILDRMSCKHKYEKMSSKIKEQFGLD